MSTNMVVHVDALSLSRTGERTVVIPVSIVWQWSRARTSPLHIATCVTLNFIHSFIHTYIARAAAVWCSQLLEVWPVQ